MMAVPADTPVTTPVNDPTLAILLAEEVHQPPPLPSIRVIPDPVQTDDGPPMAVGAAFTVIVVVVEQPEARV